MEEVALPSSLCVTTNRDVQSKHSEEGLAAIQKSLRMLEERADSDLVKLGE